MNHTTLRRIIAGAIYDFAGRLTCRTDPITLGSVHNAAPAAEACQEFLRLRGCDVGEPMIKDWAAAIAPAHESHASAVLYPAIDAAMKQLDAVPPGFSLEVDRAYNALHAAFWSECPAPASAPTLRPMPDCVEA